MHEQPNRPAELNRDGKAQLVQGLKDRIARNTCRIFIVLLLLQWVGAIITAATVSPRTWSGTASAVHVHVLAAIFLGGIITLLPVGLAWASPTQPLTRHVIAASQVLMSTLLIHITGGRVETHFHVFGSLAILAFFRDWRILITAAIIVYVDHVVRGYYWPQSVYGILQASPWRAVEHAWWVSFEVAFLIVAIRQSTGEMGAIAERQVKLQSFNTKMEAEVKQRTRELSTSNKQMEMFCDSMSHDLKAPLRGIQVFSQILMEDHGQQLDERARDCVNRINHSASRMNSLVSDLLEYSRVSRGNLSLSPVDLALASGEAIRLLVVQIQEKQAAIHLQPNLGVVQGHEAILIQVLLNLLANALTYGKPGIPPVVNIRSESRGNRLQVRVEDNGIGIAPQYHQKIFELFERIPGNDGHSGTGVGLAIVAKSIERLGGTSGVKSSPGIGSTFWFELPAVTARSGNDRAEHAALLALDA